MICQHLAMLIAVPPQDLKIQSLLVGVELLVLLSYSPIRCQELEIYVRLWRKVHIIITKAFAPFILRYMA